MSSLKRELKAEGASKQEISELSGIASSLGKLRSESFSRTHSFRWFPITLSATIGLALGMTIVVFSQSALPGSFLYPVQKMSDSVAISLDANYRGNVMMHRAEQVHELIANHASSSLVLATLKDYSSEASVYKSAASSYAAFEYCKNNLQQAAVIAPDSERQSINSTLDHLQNV